MMLIDSGLPVIFAAATPMINLGDIFWLGFLFTIVVLFIVAAFRESSGKKKAVAPRTVPVEEPSLAAAATADDGFAQESIDFDFK